MNIIDLILNLVGLLLFLKWRDNGRELSASGISLLGTLRKAGPRPARIWYSLGLIGLLVVRPLLYWLLGSALGWTPRISLGVIALPFRSDFFGRMFLFSFFSFGVALAIFYLCLLLLSILNDKNSPADPVQILVRSLLGKLDSLPTFLKLLLPWFVTLLLWCLLNKPLIALGLLPAPKSFLQLMEQGAVVGAGVYFAWKYLVVGILLLHLLNSYIYFGAWPFWNFIDNSARQILKPFSWIPLRTGKIDFAPIVFAIVLVAVTSIGLNGITMHHLNRRVPGLIDLYEWLGR